MIVTFALFLIGFAFVGIASSRKKEKNTKDYLLAGQDMKPWLVALSAVATNNSGYMFIGMIGYTFTNGLVSIWLMIGWIFGDFLASLFVYGRLKGFSSKYGLLSFGSLVANNQGKNYRAVQLISGVISLVFLSIYSAAQFKAGGKTLDVILSIPTEWGIIIGAFLVVLYCFSGGIRASIWTDAAQSIVMLVAMFILLLYAVNYHGTVNDCIGTLDKVSANYMGLIPEGKSLTVLMLFILGWVFAGFGVVGQPHIMVRYMTISNPKKIGTVRSYYYSFFIVFYCMAIVVGLLSRITLPITADFDPETALPLLSLQLLPGPLVGVMLAGIFAATISTADSLVISCTAALSNDVYPRFKQNYFVNKVFTILVTLFAVGIALWGSSSVFQLVIYSWAVLGSVFGPILLLRLLTIKVNQWTTISMMAVGGVGTILWSASEWSAYIYEMAIGITLSFVVYFVFQLFGLNTDKKQRLY